jgi:hypothetical protein
MPLNPFSLKLKVLGLGVAALVGGAALFGGAQSANASFVCSVAAPTAGNGTCWNALDSNTDSSGDFRTDAGWIDRFQTNGGGSDGDWDDLNFTTTNLVASQFATQKAFGAQDPDKVETTLEGSDWFDMDLTFVADGNISGDSIDLDNLLGNVIYIHTGGFSMAFLYDTAVPFDWFIDDVGKGLSNYRIYSTVSAVPLPAALPLFGAALLGMGYLGRRKKKKALQDA